MNLDEPYHVFLQAYADADLYVTNRTAAGFEVHLRDGETNAEFSYRIVAKRQGYADLYLSHETGKPQISLEITRDRLCLLQLSAGDGTCHLVHFRDRDYAAPNLKALLQDPGVTKIFHFARFDLAVIQHYLGVSCAPV